MAKSASAKSKKGSSSKSKKSSSSKPKKKASSSKSKKGSTKSVSFKDDKKKKKDGSKSTKSSAKKSKKDKGSKKSKKEKKAKKAKKDKKAKKAKKAKKEKKEKGSKKKKNKKKDSNASDDDSSLMSRSQGGSMYKVLSVLKFDDLEEIYKVAGFFEVHGGPTRDSVRVEDAAEFVGRLGGIYDVAKRALPNYAMDKSRKIDMSEFLEYMLEDGPDHWRTEKDKMEFFEEIRDVFDHKSEGYVTYDRFTELLDRLLGDRNEDAVADNLRPLVRLRDEDGDEQRRHVRVMLTTVDTSPLRPDPPSKLSFSSFLVVLCHALHGPRAAVLMARDAAPIIDQRLAKRHRDGSARSLDDALQDPDASSASSTPDQPPTSSLHHHPHPQQAQQAYGRYWYRDPMATQYSQTDGHRHHPSQLHHHHQYSQADASFRHHNHHQHHLHDPYGTHSGAFGRQPYHHHPSQQHRHHHGGVDDQYSRDFASRSFQQPNRRRAQYGRHSHGAAPRAGYADSQSFSGM